MKQTFFIDHSLYEYMRGTFIGLFMCMPVQYEQCGKLLSELKTDYSAATGVRFELTQDEYDVLMEALASHYNALIDLCNDDQIGRHFRELYSGDAKRLLWIAKAMIDQGLKHKMEMTATFSEKKKC